MTDRFTGAIVRLLACVWMTAYNYQKENKKEKKWFPIHLCANGTTQNLLALQLFSLADDIMA